MKMATQIIVGLIAGVGAGLLVIGAIIIATGWVQS